MLALLPAVLLAQATAYSIDPSATELAVLTAPDGLLKGASHPHVVVARKVRGTITFDPAAPETATVKVEAPADALENDDPALRKKYGMASAVDDGDRKKILGNMQEPEQLDVKKFTTVSFTSKKVKKLDGDKYELSGALTVRGVSADITVPVTVTVKDGVLKGEGSVGLTHAMFGFKPFTAALGTIRNAEALTLKLSVVAKAEKSEKAGGN